jgi:RimJ/RimL family protein N-acetyltransferase
MGHDGSIANDTTGANVVPTLVSSRRRYHRRRCDSTGRRDVRLEPQCRVAHEGSVGGTVSFDLQPVLVGELLELRPLRADDFDSLFAVASDPLIWEQHPERERYQEPTFRAFFADAIKSGGAFVALERASGQIIGSSRFFGFDANRSEIEIGWSFLARAYWGGRYNGEMKRLMLEHAFRWVERVIFVIGPDNYRSQRAVEKLGGVRARVEVVRGQERVVYELTPALYHRGATG